MTKEPWKEPWRPARDRYATAVDELTDVEVKVIVCVNTKEAGWKRHAFEQAQMMFGEGDIANVKIERLD